MNYYVIELMNYDDLGVYDCLNDLSEWVNDVNDLQDQFKAECTKAKSQDNPLKVCISEYTNDYEFIRYIELFSNDKMNELILKNGY